MLTMQTAKHHAIAGASETAGSLVFRPRERPPTQLRQAPSPLQRCAPIARSFRASCGTTAAGSIGGNSGKDSFPAARSMPDYVRGVSRVPDKGLSFAKTKNPPRVYRVGGVQGGAREPSWRFLLVLLDEVLSRAPQRKYTGALEVPEAWAAN
jgi:hypothetical protein